VSRTFAEIIAKTAKIKIRTCDAFTVKQYFVLLLNVASFRRKMQEMAEEEERQRKRDERDGTVLIATSQNAPTLLDLIGFILL
jgi:hypothetical protein